MDYHVERVIDGHDCGFGNPLGEGDDACTNLRMYQISGAEVIDGRKVTTSFYACDEHAIMWLLGILPTGTHRFSRPRAVYL